LNTKDNIQAVTRSCRRAADTSAPEAAITVGCALAVYVQRSKTIDKAYFLLTTMKYYRNKMSTRSTIATHQQIYEGIARYCVLFARAAF
jgi:hypothetical protein